MEETDTRSLSENADLQREVRIHRRRKAEMGGDLPQREKRQIVGELNFPL